MKIVMLGHSGVGKTTYMASMYGQMRQGIDGFGLISPDPQVDRELVEACQRIHAGSYPAATDQRAKYDFTLIYKGASCFSFTWLDFRGGVLDERRDSTDSSKFHKDLVTADAILLFCDATVSSERHVRRQIGRMNQMVSGAVREIEHPMPLGIVLTKMDCAADSAFGEIERKLDGLISAVSASETVVGSLLPVACGRRSWNVELPVLFTLHFGIVSQVGHLSRAIKEREQARQKYESRRGLFDEIWSLIVSEPSWGDLAAAAARDIMVQYNVLQPLLKPAQALEHHLNQLHTF